jgi:hypothetical protein
MKNMNAEVLARMARQLAEAEARGDTRRAMYLRKSIARRLNTMAARYLGVAEKE